MCEARPTEPPGGPAAPAGDGPIHQPGETRVAVYAYDELAHGHYAHETGQGRRARLCETRSTSSCIPPLCLPRYSRSRCGGQEDVGEEVEEERCSAAWKALPRHGAVSHAEGALQARAADVGMGQQLQLPSRGPVRLLSFAIHGWQREHEQS
ncbi:hypothetical protein VaNZ11_014870 [Volvox africanus]|uniref:Uncharacterized protein n=1 Tax=Volvox africanus TaxID=51714 RepID=A0ABQ5SKT0_9CHLO|nr:hypothetical protein VaNZ11_014870 [Volvox africanus]